MPTYQPASRVRVALHAEATAYAISTQTGAHVLRITDSPGLVLSRAQILSNEKRSDALREMPRLGYKSVAGSFNTELSVGGAVDLLHAAIMRATASAANVIGFATMTTVALGTSGTLTAAAGDFVGTQGIRVGDVFTISGTTTTGNNGVNYRVTAAASATLQVYPFFASALAASATGTITVLKKITNPTTPVLPTFTMEQLDQTITQSQRFNGCVLVGLRVSARPGQMATVQYSFLGVDRSFAGSEYFTSPAQTTSLQLVADDSTIRYNGSVVTHFTGFDLDLQLTAAGVPVIGSLVTPAIFDNDMGISGSIAALRSDFANLTLFDAETEFDISMLLQEPTGSPKAAFSYFLPRAKIIGIGEQVGGGDGAKQETLTLGFGPKAAATGYNTGNIVIHSSGA